MRSALDNVRSNPVFTSKARGVLGVWSEIKEVIAVFPELSFTLRPNRQEIKFFRGDAFDIPVQMQDDLDPPNGMTISQAVLRFAAKLGVGNPPGADLTIRNEGAIIIKRSYDSSEIEITNGTNGRALIHIRKPDTHVHPLGDAFLWDLEVTKPVTHLADQPGTVSVQENSDLIMGINTSFPTTFGLGDIIHVQGRYVMVLQRIDDNALKVDFTGWTDEQNITYNLYTGQTRTVAAGTWTCVGDVVI